jgi:cytochrome c553
LPHIIKLAWSKNMRFLAVLMGLICITFAARAADTPPADATSKAAETAKSVCAACHGADGNSAAATFPKLAGQHAAYIVKQLSDFKSGARNNAVMKPIASSLSADDIHGLAAYFAAQKTKQAGASTNGSGSLGEKIYRGGIAANKVPACAACHSPNGAGIPVRFPRLAGQYSDYTLAQLKAFNSGERANAPMMKMIAARMSVEEMTAVADYIQGLR